MTAPEPQPAPGRAPERRVRLLLDRALSASAGIVALTALVVSVYQSWLMRDQQHKSVWPYVRVQHNWQKAGSGYSLHVANDGLGPAIVRTVQVRVDGVAQSNWNAAARALIGRDTHAYFTTLHRGTVLLPGVDRPMVQLPVDSDAVTFWREAQRPLAADTSRGRLEIVACYCSLYDECWLSDSNVEEPRPVRACAPQRTPWSN